VLVARGFTGAPGRTRRHSPQACLVSYSSHPSGWATPGTCGGGCPLTARGNHQTTRRAHRRRGER
jgi:hypothetical protein